MSAIFGHKDPEPVLCAICGMRALAYGIISPKRGQTPKPIWTCNEFACFQASKKVYDMHPRNLDPIERKAIEEGGAAAFDKFAEAILGALWDVGIRDLAACDGPAMDKIAAHAKEDKAFHAALTQFLLAYGESVKAQLGADAAPF